MEKIKEYVLKHYPKMFQKKEIIRDSKGKITRRVTKDLTPIIVEKTNHFQIQNNKDGSPLILSKDILK